MEDLGNVVDPDELVERYGADTVRLADPVRRRPAALAELERLAPCSLRHVSATASGLSPAPTSPLGRAPRQAGRADAEAATRPCMRERLVKVVRERRGAVTRGMETSRCTRRSAMYPARRALPGLREAGRPPGSSSATADARRWSRRSPWPTRLLGRWLPTRRGAVAREAGREDDLDPLSRRPGRQTRHPRSSTSSRRQIGGLGSAGAGSPEAAAVPSAMQ